MLKKVIIFLIIINSFNTIYSQDIPNEILEAQKAEVVLLDKLYDYRDYAVELWNQIIKDSSNGIIKADQAIAALDSAIEFSALLLELEEKLIEYYSVHNPNTRNLKTSQNNKQISMGVIKEIKNLRQEFDNLKFKLINFPEPEPVVKVGPDTSQWSSIDQISDENFKTTIYDYSTTGKNIFINKKPVVLIFTETTYEPCQEQLMNMEDIYIDYNDKVIFYIITPQGNPDIIKLFQVSRVPIVYYINLEGKMVHHVGNKGYYDINETIQSHFNF